MIARDEADTIYEEENQSGNQAGKASKQTYERFEFRVAKVEPGTNNIVRFVYFQSIDIDLGIGRYHYPLEEMSLDYELLILKYFYLSKQ